MNEVTSASRVVTHTSIYYRISDVGMPDSNGVFDIHEQMDSDLIKLVSNVNSYERENVVRLENSVELLLENLQSCLSKIGLSQCAIESYETGSFITGKDAGALNTGIKIFGDLHEKNKEAYDEIYETEQKIKDGAEKRKTQGIWMIVGGAVLIATGAACIVLTGGAATPVVADVAVAVGSGTAVFGAADAIEGTQDIYYGSTGDIDSTAVNGIKDDLFQGNEDAYYLTENAFAFAASAMIPIGQASTAGNLTFKSTATIVAKEGISMGAGAGAQKITTDVTGNDTAGMVAGMVASGVTAKGLNGIEAEANKLAKAPKGIDGVTEGAGNLAEDVGKAGKGLEGAAKGAESAAEDAGKVVESGINSIDDIALKHSSVGDFTYNPKTGQISRMKGGGHGQSNINFLEENGIEYNIVKEYDNGVRGGNVPKHKTPSKRTGTGQAWFPKNWSDSKIKEAGNYVTNLPDNKNLPDGVIGYGEYDGVRVGIIKTDGKIGTIFPDADLQP